jgi:hypothetical protein
LARKRPKKKILPLKKNQLKPRKRQRMEKAKQMKQIQMLIRKKKK